MYGYICGGSVDLHICIYISTYISAYISIGNENLRQFHKSMFFKGTKMNYSPVRREEYFHPLSLYAIKLGGTCIWKKIVLASQENW